MINKLMEQLGKANLPEYDKRPWKGHLTVLTHLMIKGVTRDPD